MNLVNIGSQSRKTGIFARSGTKRDANNLEDLDDFFLRNSAQEDNSGSPRIGSQKKRQSSKRSSAASTPSRIRQAYGTPNRTTLYSSRKRRSSVSSNHSGDYQDQNGDVQLSDTESRPSNVKSIKDKIKATKASKKKLDAEIEENDGSSDDEILDGNDFNNDDVDIRTPESKRNNRQALSPASNKKTANNTASLKKKQKKNAPPVKAQKITSPVKKTTAANKISSSSKSKTVNKGARATKNIALSKSKPTKSSKPAASNEISESEPQRRSSRLRIPPVAFWKNEKVVYDYSDKRHVPTIKDVVTNDDLEEEPAKKKPTTRKRPSKKSQLQQIPKVQYVYPNDEIANELDTEDFPKAKWMEQGQNTIKVFEGPGSKQKIERTVAWAANKEVYSQQVVSKQDNFKLAILFSEEQEFAASGMLEFPVDGIKYSKNTDDTYFIFYVIAGIINVTISGNEFTVKSGCSFEIPMGNFYQFVNKGNHPAKLFFVQSKYVTIGDEDDEEEKEEEHEEGEEEE